MDLLAPLSRNVVAPLWAAWERSPYLRHYRHLRRTQYDPPEVVRRRQCSAAKEMARYAGEHSPFWRGKFRELHLRSEDIHSLEAFRYLPLLTKDDLRQQGDKLLCDVHQSTKLTRKVTSGSTGVAVEVLVDVAAQQFKRACAVRSDEWSGWRMGERVAMLWGRGCYVRTDWRGRVRNLLLERRTHLDTLAITESSLTAFTRLLSRRPPSLLYGHAHSLRLLAEYVRDHNGPHIRPRGIISTAMVLHDWEREVVEEVFGCPVTNRYGCEEVSLIACECEEHSGLHINADGVYVEILRSDGSPCDPGEIGRIVVTDLVNRAMPLLRYQIDDMGVMGHQPCPCGRGLPMLARIEGRVADYVVTPQGKMVSGISLTDHFNTLIPGVRQMQIVQEQLDRFVFRIVAESTYDESSEAKLSDLVRQHFGEVEYSCSFVDCIPHEPSGKYRFCISKVANSFGTVSTEQPTIDPR